MSRHSTHENREIPGIPDRRATADRTGGKSASSMAAMHVPGKWDTGAVPIKPSNKPVPLAGAEMAASREPLNIGG
jgi:hypothetical protein